VDTTEARIRSLCSDADLSVLEIAPLTGDVGQLRYFRAALARGTVVAVVYPRGQEEACLRWNRVRQALAPKVRVPRVLAEDVSGRIQILEDFGTRPLSGLWVESRRDRDRRHAEAAAIAADIASTPDPGVNPPFSAEFFFGEMEKSCEAFFSQLARAPLSTEERSVHDAFARALAEEIAGHPRAFVHRDFHVDNLFDAGGTIGVIDFQDARLGPDSYDVASLIGERAALVVPDAAAAEAAIAAFSNGFRPPSGFRRRLRRVALQRGWKAAGTFARVCAEGRGETYRRFLAPQLAAAERNLNKTDVERDFAAILNRRSVKLFGKEAPC